MDKSLKFLQYSILTVLLLGIGYDQVMVANYKTLFKDSLDLSTKAAALQLDEDETKIGQGIFEIDVEKAKQLNNDIFKKNVGEKLYNSIEDTVVLNVHDKTTYVAPNGKKYSIDSPTVFCSIKFEYDGIFVKQNIEYQTLSGASLLNINDLN